MSDLFTNDSLSQEVDYTELLHKFIYRAKVVLRRFWWIVPLAIALGTTYKGIEAFLEEPTYRSDARMMVSGRIALPENELYAEERNNFFGTQIELMESGQVKSRAVERIKLTHPELHGALVNTDLYVSEGMGSINLDASVKRDTSIFRLRAYSPHQGYTKEFLDAVMAEYINRRNEMRAKTSERTYDAIVAQLSQLELEITAGEDAIVDFQKQNNIVFIQEQGSAAGAYLADLKRRLAELKTESRALASVGESSGAASVILPGASGEDAQLGATSMNALGSEEDREKYILAKEQLEVLRAELEEFEIYLKPKHPKIIGLKDQIERTSNQIEIFRRQALDRVAERSLVIAQRIQNLNAEIEIWEQSALENGRLIAEFERLQSRLLRSKEAYERNQEALRAIDTGQSLSQETVSVLENAGLASPAGKGMIIRFAEGVAYGIVLATGLLFLISFLDNRVFSATEVGRNFSEPVIGAIPFEKEHNGDPSTVLLQRDDERFIFAEACRNLRTSVFFMGDDGAKPSTFAVTSAIPAEGKSTVSANLSVALSFSHSKVLLLDADLRRGRLHKLFKLNFEGGLTNVLQGDLDIADAIQPTSYSNLDFVSIGGHPDHPAELLMSDRMKDVIKWAKEHYDFIIFDTAPILATDDTTSFSRNVDAVIFTIRCSHTQIRQVKPAISRLKERGIGVDGIILNYVDTAQPGYYYYRYSEYYTRPEKSDAKVSSATSA